jgi:hypothetical protein
MADQNPFDVFDAQQPKAAPETMQPKTAQPNPFDVFDAQPTSHWGVNWKGDVTFPQPVQDFGNVAGNEAAMAISPELRAQSAAAKARLGPVASTVAETLGYYASPTTLLNTVPVAGGLLAGGLHEGIKSKFEGDDWTTAAEKAGIGGATGLASTGIAHVLTSPSVLSKLVDVAGTGGVGALAQSLFSHSPAAGYVGANMGSRWVQPAVKWVENKSGPLVTALRPYVAAGLQGTTSALQPQQGWSQWVTGQ